MSSSKVNKKYGVLEEHKKHICTLDAEHANAYRPDDRSLRSATIISSRNPNTRYFFRSLTLVEKERQRQIKLKYSHIIHPLSEFRLYWEVAQLFILFIGLIICPINFIHGPVLYNQKTYFGFNIWFAYAEIFFDILYLTDVVMTFFTGFIDARYQVVHLNIRLIARKYLASTQFLYDIPSGISTMTILQIYRSMITETFITINQLRWWRLIGAFKLFRVARFLKYLQNASELLHHYYYSKLVIRYFVLICIGLHWLTCIYITMEQSTQVYSLYLHVNENEFEDMEILSFNYETLLLLDYGHMYVYAQSIVATQILWISTTYSFGTLVDRQLRHYGNITQLTIYGTAGLILSTLLSVLILQMILSTNASEAKYHSIMSQLLNYMKLKALPQNMKERFVCYYEYRFQKNYFREATIMSKLSESLRHDINLHSCRSLIQNVSILRDLPHEIISEVVFHLKHEVYLYNDIIVKAETIGDCMYFIANGSVAVLTPSGREICHLQDGSYFGEIALIASNQKRTANVIAIEICEVYRLERAHFSTCFPKNTMFYKKIQQTAQERKEKTVLLEELHKKYQIDRGVSEAHFFRSSTKYNK